jgi:tetratricopeptide (TPR) repeat protein/transcriptional regulator with XRE-family HTH domain
MNLVRAQRLRLGLSQDDLAARSGVSVRSIQLLEARTDRRVRPSTARLLADALQVPAGERESFIGSLVHGALGRSARSVNAQVRPAMLPAPPYEFTGRLDSIDQLNRLLRRSQREPTTAVVGVICGPAGIGKTALAVHWGHWAADQFPDGQLYCNLRGFDAGGECVSATEAVQVMLDALGAPPARIPTGLDAQVALYRSLLAGRRALLVLDNARDANQVRPLLPGRPGCMVLVTSRHLPHSLVAIEGAQPITVEVFPPAEAAQFLARRLGDDRVNDHPAALETIVEVCAGLPLALAIVAARAVAKPRQPLHRFADELRMGDRPLDAFAGDDPGTNLRAAFSWSYHALSPPAARLFRMLGRHPHREFSAAAAASAGGMTTGAVRQPLAELTRAHLLTEPADGRFAFHDLLWAYAVELGELVDTDADRRAALRRILDHYVHTAHTAARLIHPQRDPLTLPTRAPDVTTVDLTSPEQAISWFTRECQVLPAVIDYAAARFDSHIWPLAWALRSFLQRRGHWHLWVTTQHAALDAVTRLRDRSAQARAHNGLAAAYGHLGKEGEALHHLRQALHLNVELGDRNGQGHTHIALAWLSGRSGSLREALQHAEQALGLFRQTGHTIGEANALNSIGFTHAQLGNHRQALVACGQALARLRQLGDPDGEATTWDSIGFAHHHLGQHRKAINCFNRALELYAALGDHHREAETLIHLGDAHQAIDETDAARQAWQRAADFQPDLGDQNTAKALARLATLPKLSVRQSPRVSGRDQVKA